MASSDFLFQVYTELISVERNQKILSTGDSRAFELRLKTVEFGGYIINLLWDAFSFRCLNIYVFILNFLKILLNPCYMPNI